MKFKVKRHWWIWALFILWHAFAIRFLQSGIYSALFYITVILDIIVIFPTASHLKYEITYGQLTVKRVIYPDISFPCKLIIAVEKAELLELKGGPFKIEGSLGAYKLTYIIKKRAHEFEKTVVIGAKKHYEFLNELAMNVSAKVKNDIRYLIKDFNINGNSVVKFKK